MTRHMNNPFKRLEGARHYSISTELFFCLIKLYRDCSKKRAGFELAKYYESALIMIMGRMYVLEGNFL